VTKPSQHESRTPNFSVNCPVIAHWPVGLTLSFNEEDAGSPHECNHNTVQTHTMKRQITKNYTLLAVASSALVALPVNAANSFYAPGDLVLYFQREGSANTIYANLGNAANLYRGANSGIAGNDYQLTRTNILNLNSTLTSAFGSNWASESNIYAGLAGVWRTSDTNTGVLNGDPSRTVYISQARQTVGTVGSASSNAWVIAGDTQMSSAATGVFAQNNAFEVNYDAGVTLSLTSVSLIDDQNPFFAPGLQGAAMNEAFEGGVQQKGSASSFGSFDGVGSVEFALDLYRILGRNDLAQVGGTVRTGSYEGTVVVGTNGQVSFLVPEPSSFALSGLALGGLLLRRRRSA
jgi:hypothetical protein